MQLWRMPITYYEISIAAKFGLQTNSVAVLVKFLELQTVFIPICNATRPYDMQWIGMVAI